MTATLHPTPIPAVAPGDRRVDGGGAGCGIRDNDGGVESELVDVVLVSDAEEVVIELVDSGYIVEDVAGELVFVKSHQIAEATESASLASLTSPVMGSTKYVEPVSQHLLDEPWQYILSPQYFTSIHSLRVSRGLI